MPKRSDIKKILLIGSGPIIISQACEFDYSGTQACKALREEGYEVVLINSNPATIMTDPEMADRTYIEPITPEAVAKIIARERPDALLPTLGGIFLAETLSVIIQRGYFKYTKRKYGEGRRVFRMAPLHHHFELLGWPEPKIVTRFYIAAILLMILSLATFKVR